MPASGAAIILDVQGYMSRLESPEHVRAQVINGLSSYFTVLTVQVGSLPTGTFSGTEYYEAVVQIRLPVSYPSIDDVTSIVSGVFAEATKVFGVAGTIPLAVTARGYLSTTTPPPSTTVFEDWGLGSFGGTTRWIVVGLIAVAVIVVGSKV